MLTLGESEIADGTVQVKDMATGEQQTVDQKVVIENFASLYKETLED